MNLKNKAKEIKRYIPALFIALRNKETPVLAKLLAAITVGYALSPIDLIPDFIPVLGYLDDLIIVPALIALTIKSIPKEIMEKSLIESENLWKYGKPKKWYYGIPIAVLWVMIIFLILYKIFK